MIKARHTPEPRKVRALSAEELRHLLELARTLAPQKRRFKVKTIPFGMEK